MKRLSALIVFTACFFIFSVITVTPQTVDNQLSNPGFEEEFESHEGESPQKVATDWTPWHVPQAAGSPAYSNHAPFYDEETVRIRGDEEGKAQVYFNQFATHQGGIYQQVDDLTDDTSYRFSIYAWVWSSTGEDWTVSEQPGNVSVRVGIDPSGGTDGTSDDIVWSTTAVFLYNAYYQYSVIAAADGATVTVFVESTVGEPVANNYIYLDDAVLEAATQTVVNVDASPTSETNLELGQETPEEATPTQEPTATPTQEPTETPESTETTEPTATATETPEPAATMPLDVEQRDTNIESSKEPTETPAPSVTPEVVAKPTDTPEPTATSTTVPSDTPSPTDTAIPSATATGDTADPITEEFPDTIVHVVVEGDTVSAIALEYGSRVDAIRRANGLNRASVIFIGQRLIVPINLPDPTATPLPPDQPTPTNSPVPPTDTPIPPTATATPLPTATPITYIIQSGDTLVDIAARYGTTADELATLNGIANPNQINVGLVLLIPTAIPPTPTSTATSRPTVQPSSSLTQYTVQAGDTLDGIARDFNTTVDAIAQLNGITNPSLIFPGLVLQIPSAGSAGTPQSGPTATAAPLPTPTPLPTAIPTRYTVQTGDTLFQIAIRFAVSVVELAAINNIIDYNQINVGQVLTIPG